MTTIIKQDAEARALEESISREEALLEAAAAKVVCPKEWGAAVLMKQLRIQLCDVVDHLAQTQVSEYMCVLAEVVGNERQAMGCSSQRNTLL